MSCGDGNTSEPPNLDADLRPGAGSSCIDAVDSAALPSDEDDVDGDGIIDEPYPFDRSGGARVTGAAVDMGAFEKP